MSSSYSISSTGAGSLDDRRRRRRRSNASQATHHSVQSTPAHLAASNFDYHAQMQHQRQHAHLNAHMQQRQQEQHLVYLTHHQQQQQMFNSHTDFPNHTTAPGGISSAYHSSIYPPPSSGASVLSASSSLDQQYLSHTHANPNTTYIVHRAAGEPPLLSGSAGGLHHKVQLRNHQRTRPPPHSSATQSPPTSTYKQTQPAHPPTSAFQPKIPSDIHHQQKHPTAPSSNSNKEPQYLLKQITIRAKPILVSNIQQLQQQSSQKTSTKQEQQKSTGLLHSILSADQQQVKQQQQQQQQQQQISPAGNTSVSSPPSQQQVQPVCLTTPGEPCSNNGMDNAEGNLIVYAGDIITTTIHDESTNTPNSDTTSTNTVKKSYKALSLLGQGTFAQVFLCQDISDQSQQSNPSNQSNEPETNLASQTENLVALKIVKNKLAYTRQASVEIDVFAALQKSQQQQQSSASMSSSSTTSTATTQRIKTTILKKSKNNDTQDHFVRMMTHFTYQNHLCLVFERLGWNLYEVLKQGRFQGLPLSTVQSLLKQALLGLDILCQHAIVHCDLKPENMLLLLISHQRNNGDTDATTSGNSNDDKNNTAKQQQQQRGKKESSSSLSTKDQLLKAGSTPNTTDTDPSTGSSSSSSSCAASSNSASSASSSSSSTLSPKKKKSSAPSMRIKLIDFGSACFETTSTNSTQQQHLQQHTYIQSRFYRSPEVLMGLPYDSAIDIWSLGCVAAELFLGLPILPGIHEHDQLIRIQDMIGPIPEWMLEQGSKSGRYFVKQASSRTRHTQRTATPPVALSSAISSSSSSPAGATSILSTSSSTLNNGGGCVWRIKTQQEYIQSLTASEIKKKGGLSKLQNPPSNRYFRPTLLEDIVWTHGQRISAFQQQQKLQKRKQLEEVKEDGSVRSRSSTKSGGSNSSEQQRRQAKVQLKLFIHFLKGLLEPDPWKRWTAKQALQHPFLNDEDENDSNNDVVKSSDERKGVDNRTEKEDQEEESDDIICNWVPPWDPSICRRRLVSVQKIRERQQLMQKQSKRNFNSASTSYNTDRVTMPDKLRVVGGSGSTSTSRVTTMTDAMSLSRQSDSGRTSPPSSLSTANRNKFTPSATSGTAPSAPESLGSVTALHPAENSSGGQISYITTGSVTTDYSGGGGGVISVMPPMLQSHQSQGHVHGYSYNEILHHQNVPMGPQSYSAAIAATANANGYNDGMFGVAGGSYTHDVRGVAGPADADFGYALQRPGVVPGGDTGSLSSLTQPHNPATTALAGTAYSPSSHSINSLAGRTSAGSWTSGGGGGNQSRRRRRHQQHQAPSSLHASASSVPMPPRGHHQHHHYHPSGGTHLHSMSIQEDSSESQISPPLQNETMPSVQQPPTSTSHGGPPNDPVPSQQGASGRGGATSLLAQQLESEQQPAYNSGRQAYYRGDSGRLYVDESLLPPGYAVHGASSSMPLRQQHRYHHLAQQHQRQHYVSSASSVGSGYSHYSGSGYEQQHRHVPSMLGSHASGLDSGVNSVASISTTGRGDQQPTATYETTSYHPSSAYAGHVPVRQHSQRQLQQHELLAQNQHAFILRQQQEQQRHHNKYRGSSM